MFPYHPGPKVVLVVSQGLCFRHKSSYVLSMVSYALSLWISLLKSFCCKEVPGRPKHTDDEVLGNKPSIIFNPMVFEH